MGRYLELAKSIEKNIQKAGGYTASENDPTLCTRQNAVQDTHLDATDNKPEAKLMTVDDIKEALGGEYVRLVYKNPE
jgi:hypothetical protein